MPSAELIPATIIIAAVILLLVILALFVYARCAAGRTANRWTWANAWTSGPALRSGDRPAIRDRSRSPASPWRFSRLPDRALRTGPDSVPEIDAMVAHEPGKDRRLPAQPHG